MKRQWIRLWVKVRTDPKVQRLPPPVFKFWINLLCLAGERDSPDVSRVSHEPWAASARPDHVLKWFDILINHGLIELKDGLEGRYVIHDWEEYQYDSDSSTERVKRFRERQRNVSVTLESRSRADTEKSRAIEVDLNTPPLPPQSAAAAAPPARPQELASAAEIAAAAPLLAAAASPPAEPAKPNGAAPEFPRFDSFDSDIEQAIHQLVQEGNQLPEPSVVNQYGRRDPNPAYERMIAALRHAEPRIRAARMPVAFARKVILDSLKSA